MVYIQTRKIDSIKTIGIVITEMLCHKGFGGYIAYEYELKRNPDEIILNLRREFTGKSNEENYQDFQEFAKKETGAEAVFYDPDSHFVSGALEKAVRNHVDMS